MEFSSRIKKEMAEGIVRAILEDAGYRVIDSGIEKVLREISCLGQAEYERLGYPDAMSRLPDFTVMNRAQDEKFLVEVKYRSDWNKKVLESVRDQVRIFGEVTLVSINAGADNPGNLPPSPSRFIRCCGLRFSGETYEIEQRSRAGETSWRAIGDVHDDASLWWSMSPLYEKFPKIREKKEDRTLLKAVDCIRGILE